MICAGVILVLGLIILALGVAALLQTYYTYSRVLTWRATGVVVAFTEEDGEGCVRPVVRFAHDGRDITFEGSVGSSPPTYRVGQGVALRFAPGEPSQAVIDDFQSLYLLPVALVGIGVFVLVTGAIIAAVSVP